VVLGRTFLFFDFHLVVRVTSWARPGLRGNEWTKTS
jgi:hypothetical protein